MANTNGKLIRKLRGAQLGDQFDAFDQNILTFGHVLTILQE